MKKPVTKEDQQSGLNYERLDIPIRISTSKSWITWVLIALLFIGALLWSIFGKISTRVEGMGIIMPIADRTPILKVIPQGNGMITSIKVKTGDSVTKGQIVVEIAQEKLEKQISAAKTYVNELQAEKNKLLEKTSRQTDLMNDYFKDYLTALEQQKKNTEEYKMFIEAFVKKEKQLQKEGAISLVDMQTRQKDLYTTEENLRNIASERSKSMSDMANYNITIYKELIDIDLQLKKAADQLAELQVEYDLDKTAVSPASGVINQILCSEGDYVTSGTPLMTVVQGSLEDDAVAFFSPLQGKKISQGMQAFATPTILKREENGAIIGKVVFVSKFPVGQRVIASMLRDEALANLITNNGAAIMVKIDLEQNTPALDDFRWTTGRQPPYNINAGTLCNVSVYVGNHRPISLVIPFLKNCLLGIGE